MLHLFIINMGIIILRPESRRTYFLMILKKFDKKILFLVSQFMGNLLYIQAGGQQHIPGQFHFFSGYILFQPNSVYFFEKLADIIGVITKILRNFQNCYIFF